MAGIPVKTNKWAFIRQSWFWPFAGAIVSSTVTCWNLYKNASPSGILIIQSLGFFAIAFNAFNQWQNEEKKAQCYELEGCLFTLHDILTLSVLEGDDDPQLRLTVHATLQEGAKLQQLLDYVGSQRSGRTRGRQFSAQSGAIGQCARTKQAIIGHRENIDYQKYVDELVSVWHYLEADARRMDPSTMSWMAIPLFKDENNEDLVAVLYLDSTNVNFFDAEREIIILNASTGIARFVKQLYYKA